MTKKEILTAMLDKYTFTADETEMLTKMLDSLNRKTAKKPSKTAQFVEAHGGEIVDFIHANGSVTTKAVGDAFGVSTQKMTPVLRLMAENGMISKTVEKSVNVYKVA